MTGRFRGGRAFLLLLLFGTACAVSPGYHRAEILYKEGRYRVAAEAFRDFLRENPRSSLVPAGTLGLAWSEYQQGNYREAVAAVETIRSRFPGHPILPAARLLEAKSLFEMHEFVRAATEARALADELGRNGVGLEARLVEARALAASLRHDAAAERFEEYLALAPHGTAYLADAWLGRADALFAAGKSHEAAGAYRAYYERFPTSPQHPRALAVYARAVERDSPSVAIASWEEYLAEYPSGPDLEDALRRLMSLSAAQDHPAAGAYADRLLRTGSETSAISAARFLLEAARAEGDTPSREAVEREILARFSPSITLYAEVLADRIHRDLAPFSGEEAWRARLRDLDLPLLPAGPGVGDALARAAAYLRDYDGHPRAGQIARDRAATLFVLGRWEEAEAATAREIERYGETLEGVLRLAEIRRARGDNVRAREVLLGALADLSDSHPLRPSVLYRLAILAEAEGDLLEAVRRVREVRRLSPERLTAPERAYWQMREEEVARLAATPLPPLRAIPSGKISVYLHGFESEGETTGIGGTILSVLAAGLTLDPAFEVVPGARVHGAEAAFDNPAHPPTSLFPLRATIGADYLIGGKIRREGEKTLLDLRILAIRPEGIGEISRNYIIAPEARLAFPRRILAEAQGIMRGGR